MLGIPLTRLPVLEEKMNSDSPSDTLSVSPGRSQKSAMRLELSESNAFAQSLLLQVLEVWSGSPVRLSTHTIKSDGPELAGMYIYKNVSIVGKVIRETGDGGAGPEQYIDAALTLIKSSDANTKWRPRGPLYFELDDYTFVAFWSDYHHEHFLPQVEVINESHVASGKIRCIGRSRTDRTEIML